MEIKLLEPCRGRELEHFEVTANIFENLVRLDKGANPIPWLAESIEARDGGRTYRVVLRKGVSFHDGRPLSARDVRYTFEQVLRQDFHFLLLSVRGAARFRARETTRLEGFRIEGHDAFTIELEEPVAFFPTILSNPALAVVPEGGQKFMNNWQEGCAGTGPFRLIRFEPRRLVDLERNPDYWRYGHPRVKRLSFSLGVDAEDGRNGFLDGRYTLASDLRPEDMAQLSQKQQYLAGYAEQPRLSTYFLAFNTRRGPFASARHREALARALEAESFVRETLGDLVTPALGLLPPHLLGKMEESRPFPPATDDDRAMLDGLSLRIAVLPSYHRQYEVFWERLSSRLEALGITFSAVTGKVEELSPEIRSGEVDLAFHRWKADFPDSDGFFFGLLHEDGVLARLCGSETMHQRLAQARGDHDPARRFATYQAIGQELTTHVLLIPFFHEKSYRFAQPAVRDLRLGLCLPEVHYDELRILEPLQPLAMDVG